MPFELRNAPDTFLQNIDVILSTGKWQFALVNFDNIVVLSKSSREHTVHVRNKRTVFSSAGGTLKLKNRRSFVETIDYLGPLIYQSRLKIESHTTDAIWKLQPPTFSRNSDSS